MAPNYFDGDNQNKMSQRHVRKTNIYEKFDSESSHENWFGKESPQEHVQFRGNVQKPFAVLYLSLKSGALYLAPGMGSSSFFSKVI